MFVLYFNIVYASYCEILNATCAPIVAELVSIFDSEWRSEFMNNQVKILLLNFEIRFGDIFRIGRVGFDQL